MNENMNKKIKISMVVAILAIILILTGVTFAVVSFITTSDQNLIKSGKVSMSYTESSRTIDLTNALPVTDEIGKNSTEYFDFTIMSNADTNADDNEGIRIPYNLIIEPKVVDSDKDALTNEQIKIYLTKVEGGVETPVVNPTKISELTKVDTNFNLYNTENIHKNNNGAITTDYRVRAWIDYNVDVSTWKSTSKQKQYKFAINVNATGELNTPIPGAKMLIKKVGTGGLVKDEHPATEQLQATTTYRYTGTNPDNYINFNNETWRILGVFDTDDGTGKVEQRIKIVRNESIGESMYDPINWDNDWSRSGLKDELNGTYYDGLATDAKDNIGNAVYYLGGVSTEEYENYLVSDFYSYERGTTVYSGNETRWTGKIGMIYPSDYLYATSGGGTTNRDSCLAKEISWWGGTDCYYNVWLNKSNIGWTITPGSSSGGAVFLAFSGISYDDKAHYVYPVAYLKSDVKLTGEGTSSSPYEISK